MNADQVEQLRIEFKEKLKIIEDKIKEVSKVLNPLIAEKENLLQSCTHYVVCDKCRQQKCICKGKWPCSSPRCLICGEHIGDGWYCPGSPDQECHYYTLEDENGYYTEMRDGSKVYMPKEYDNKDYETDDDCLFCHQPEERK